MASTRFDLPQPLGPTTPVRPASILKSVGSQKLLNPARRSRSNFMGSEPSALLLDTVAPEMRSARVYVGPTPPTLLRVRHAAASR